MSSKKRRSDVGHLDKFDYYAAEKKSFQDGNDGGPSQLMTAEEQQRSGRRVIRVERPANPSGISAPAAPPSGGKNPFAGVNLMGGSGGGSSSSSSKSFSFGAATSAKPAAIAGASAAPVLGGFGAPATASSTPASSSTKTTTTSAKRTRTDLSTTSRTPARAVSSSDKDVANFFVQQDKTFKDAWGKDDPGGADQSKVMWKYLVFRLCREAALKMSDTMANRGTDSKTTVFSPSTTTPKSSTTTTAAPSGSAGRTPGLALSKKNKEVPSTGFSFGGGSKTSTTKSTPSTGGFSFGGATASTSPVPVPATGGFSFGGSASKSPAPAPATGGFSFGGSASKSPAPAPATGGFSFGGSASKTPAPAPAAGGFSFSPAAPTTTTSTSQTSSTFGSGAGATEETKNEDDDEVERAEDPDWDDEKAFNPIVVYHKKGEQFKNFASGELRLQVSKKDKQKFRMVMRDKKGLKVLLNMLITKDMEFKSREYTSKGRKIATILFVGLNQGEKKMLMYQMKSTTDVISPLRAKLTELREKTA